MPFAILHFIELFFRRDLMIWFQLDQSFRQQQIKDLVGFGDVEPIWLRLFLPKRTCHRLLSILHPLSRCDRFLLLFRLITSRLFHIVDLLLKRLLGLVGSSLSYHPTRDLANTFKLLRCIFIFNERQEPIECCIGQLLIGQNQTVTSILDISKSLDKSSNRFIVSLSQAGQIGQL